MGPVEISFVLPCHNAGPLLQAAVESIRAQRGDFEIAQIIVVDDKSDQSETLDLLQDLRRGGVQIVSNPGRRGPGAARNHGASLVRARWIAFLDADDLLTTDSVQRRVSAVQAFPDACYFGADFAMWWPEDRTDEPFFRSRPAPARYLAHAYELGGPIILKRPVGQFLDACMCHSGTVLVEKSLFERVGGYEESLMFCEDHHLWIKLAREADFVFTPHVVMLYRQHPNSMTMLPFPESGHYSKALELLHHDASFREYRGVIRKLLSRCRAQTAEWYRSQNRFSDASREAWRGIVEDPSSLRAWKQIAASLLRVA